MVEVRCEPYGPGLIGALADEVRRAQGGDVFAPVTVLVPRGSVALAMRRRLAEGGIANVTVTTIPRLLADLGTTGMARAGRRPVTTTLIEGAARSALMRDADALVRAVAEQASTVSSLVATYRDVRPVLGSMKARRADVGARAAATLRLCAQMQDQLAEWYDEVDLVDVVTGGASVPVTTGPIVVFAPKVPMRRHHERFLRWLAAHVTVRALVGQTGEEAVDMVTRDALSALGATCDFRPGEEDGRLVDGIVSAPTIDAEIRAVIRRVVQRLEAGTRFEHIAIVHSGMSPYPRALRDALHRSGIRFNGPEVRTLADTVPGRVLLGFLGLAEGDWRREDLSAWAATGPILFERKPIPAASFDRLLRDAGVLGGQEEMVDSLELYRRALRARVDDLRFHDEVAPSVVGALDRDICDLDLLLRFFSDLVRRFVDPQRSWGGWAGWARRILDDLLGGPLAELSWEFGEGEAATMLDEVLGEIAGLDALGHGEGDVSRRGFLAVLASALRRPAPQTSRFGQGLRLTTLRDAPLTGISEAYLVGMAEGAFPPSAPDDPLLPDRDRAAVDVGLERRGLAAIGGLADFRSLRATVDRIVLSFARSDGRSRAEMQPSPWLLAELRRLALVGGLPVPDGRLYAGDLPELLAGESIPSFTFLESLAATLAEGGPAIDVADVELRGLIEGVRRGGVPAELSKNSQILASLRVVEERRRGIFGIFEGAASEVADDISSPSAGAIQSPTGLETFATCPRRYLLSRLLGVRALMDPAEAHRINPLDRGSLLHDILRRHVQAEIDGRGTGDVETIRAFAEPVFAEFEESGRVGRPLLWEIERARIVGDLERFVRADTAWRQRSGAIPVAVEMRFSSEGSGAVVIFDDGRTVRFRGSVDRVDRLPDDRFVVVDYKTGNNPVTTSDLTADPFGGGRRLQLPVYSLAVRDHFRGEAVEPSYWNLSDAGNFALAGYEMDANREAEFGNVVQTLVDAIEDGVFPATPGPDDGRGIGGSRCRYCDFDSLCPTGRRRIWNRIRTDSRVATLAALTDPQDAP